MKTELTLNLSDDHRRALRYCTYCPKLCRYACPVAHGEANETSTPWGKMRLLNMVDQGHVEADSSVLDALARCISCGRCRSSCKHETPVGEVLAWGRGELVSNGVEPTAAFAEHSHCPRAVAVPAFTPTNPLATFSASCAHFGDAASSKRLLSALDALERLGLPMLLDACSGNCGYRRWEAGYPSEAAEAAEPFLARGALKRRVTDCAPALWYGELEERGPIEATHLVEFLHENLERLPANTVKGPVAVHDDCFTSRQLGLGDSLRALIVHATGQEPIELFESRDAARCCGSQGAWAEQAGEALPRARESVVVDILDSGARLVLSGSSVCSRGLQQQLDARSETNGAAVGGGVRAVAMIDLFDFILRIAEPQPKSPR